MGIAIGHCSPNAQLADGQRQAHLKADHVCRCLGWQGRRGTQCRSPSALRPSKTSAKVRLAMTKLSGGRWVRQRLAGKCSASWSLHYHIVWMHSTKWPSDQQAARCQGQDSDHSLGRSRECGTCSLRSASSSEAQNSTCWTCRGSKELVDCASLFGMVQSEIVSSAEVSRVHVIKASAARAAAAATASFRAACAALRRCACRRGSGNTGAFPAQRRAARQRS